VVELKWCGSTRPEELQDPEAGGAILIFYAEKEGQEPTLTKIEKEYDEKLHAVTRKTTKDDIIMAFELPPVLLLQTPGKLGGPEYNEAIDIYNNVTAKYRLRLERAFKEIFSNSADPLLRVIPEGQTSPDYSIEPVGGIQTGLGIRESLIPQFISILGNSTISKAEKYHSLINIFGIAEEVVKTIIPDPNAGDTAVD